MKTSFNLICRLVALLSVCLAASTANADQAIKHKAIKHKTSAVVAVKWPQTCPVSGEKIASASDAVGSSVYKGKTFYFCCSMCKPLFDKAPAKYAAAAAAGKYLMPM